ncbi:hypothetical protein KVF89_22385 [Nocardioides carbamazepini]|uniref:hypothetical protein n=1 Tax=Nocardioides carbamazepini TaxID=2854259 RepID=UPI0021499B43|nr:hypothetical protein [Nocardioides carbamazepini]MCR1785305.1 hypothetical protein [Nocardioides carbamazepini]
MRVKVRHHIDRLAQRQESAAVDFTPKASRAVRQSTQFGRDLARALAREKAGPHGEHYWKRVNAEMTGILEGEFGPDGTPKSNFVGVGFRHGRNTDLPKAADKVGPDLTARVRKILAESL